MRNYAPKNYNKGYKTAPELIAVFVIFAYLFSELDWDRIFGFIG